MHIEPTDLLTLRRPLEDALSAYENITGLKFSDFPDLIHTPEKPNSARTIIPVTYKSAKVGDLYTIVFVKGDGTGDSKTYKLNELVIPSEFQFTDKSDRIIPRSKTGVIREGFFPFFSITPKGNTVMYAASLEELSLDGKTIAPIWRLGLNDADYSAALQNQEATTPQIYVTVGEAKDGKRIGDPHAIHYSRHIADAIQVVGFLSINDLDNPYAKNSMNWKCENDCS
jgi:hypothetical protein